jgi:hypothetical protein
MNGQDRCMCALVAVVIVAGCVWAIWPCLPRIAEDIGWYWEGLVIAWWELVNSLGLGQ